MTLHKKTTIPICIFA